MSNFEDVKKFMKTFGQKVITKPQFPDEKTMNLRFDLIKEELNGLIFSIIFGFLFKKALVYTIIEKAPLLFNA